MLYIACSTHLIISITSKFTALQAHQNMRCILILATTQALQPPAPRTIRQQLHATSNASEDPLQTLQTNVDAIWSLPGTGPANVRSRMTRERKEATHATLWGKKE